MDGVRHPPRGHLNTDGASLRQNFAGGSYLYTWAGVSFTFPQSFYLEKKHFKNVSNIIE
jgi:hypothetical protein